MTVARIQKRRHLNYFNNFPQKILKNNSTFIIKIPQAIETHVERSAGVEQRGSATSHDMYSARLPRAETAVIQPYQGSIGVTGSRPLDRDRPITMLRDRRPVITQSDSFYYTSPDTT